VKRVFVANRGEIALRIVHACRALGLECVVGASEADLDGAAAQAADRVVCIGPGPAALSYLRDDVIVHAALSTGCDAIHPGYGFLSESPRLAARAAEHGITFAGPPAKVIALAGDKLRARERAERAGVPVLPGGEAPDFDHAAALAASIGYPVLLKAAGGGGGRGIKLAQAEQQLRALLGLARSEAGAAFGDERIYVERFIPAARHVEVQIVADEFGTTLHLGERDCSVQRRYQKLIEEAPARALPQATRVALHSAAVAFARAIGYRNVGTVEFVVDGASGDFYFLEINCRIQVEHPVTEAVTGLDLVALQLRLADGGPVGLRQDELTVSGHAIECRLNADDVGQGLRPTPGTLSRFCAPELPRLRVDTHCRTGTTVPPYYDSLLAKLIAHGQDREAATALLLEALDGLEIDGVPTNRSLLVGVLEHPDFREAKITTDWLERALV
jgi:acetyl-CoA carboxylase, biotin carboxylase subunit